MDFKYIWLQVHVICTSSQPITKNNSSLTLRIKNTRTSSTIPKPQLCNILRGDVAHRDLHTLLLLPILSFLKPLPPLRSILSLLELQPPPWDSMINLDQSWAFLNTCLAIKLWWIKFWLTFCNLWGHQVHLQHNKVWLLLWVAT